MKREDDILRKALSGLFDIQAESSKVVVTAPSPLCDEFYRYLSDQHPDCRKIMLRPPQELGQEIHFNNSSADQVKSWVNSFTQALNPHSVTECYHAIYP